MRRWRQGQALAAVLALLLAVGAVRPAQAFEQGLLWQVTAQGKVRGYVFGTIHLGDPRVAEIRPGVADALIASDAVVTELAMDLAGERGVLRLLERRGQSVTRMPL
ncbi:MAG: TraB/GumN family protein [Pseudomonadota bacterium]